MLRQVAVGGVIFACATHYQDDWTSGLQIIAKVAGVLLTALGVQLMILRFRDLGMIDTALVH